jgi:hypothetical protein
MVASAAVVIFMIAFLVVVILALAGGFDADAMAQWGSSMLLVSIVAIVVTMMGAGAEHEFRRVTEGEYNNIFNKVWSDSLSEVAENSGGPTEALLGGV